MKKKSAGRQAAVLFGSGLFGALIGIAIVKTFGDAATGIVPGPAGVLVALVLFLVCILIHEGGHLAAGALVGFRPLVLIAGPLRVERAGGRTTLGFNRAISLAGGLAICTPVGIHDLRRRTMIMAAGGPLASLLFGVQCLAVWMALSPLFAGGGTMTSLVAFALLLGGVVSLAIGLLTLMPMRTGGFYSDGARILRLMRNDAETEREVALMALTCLTLGGTRPRDWDRTLVERAAGIRDGGAFEAGALQFAHLHALDSGDVAAARDSLERTLERVDLLPRSARGSVYLGAAVFFGLYERDPVRARACLEAADPAGALLAAPHQRPLADAAVRLAEGDAAGAAAAAGAARDLMSRALDQGGVALDIAHAERILSAAAAAPGSPESAEHRTPTPAD